MSDPDSESGKLQGGKQSMSPSSAILRAGAASDTDDSTAGVVDVSAPAEELPPTFRDILIASLTSLATMSFFSSAFFHLFVWGTALLLLPLFGLEWLEFSTVEVPPISASLGDEEVLDDLPKMNVIGSVDIDNDEPSSSLQELAQRLQESETAWLRSANEEALSPLSIEADGEDGGGILLKIPDEGFAVTKGSFTAFTIPAEPEPLKPYRIVIEVRLPSDVKKYRVNDLKGEVIGTDGYKQFLPYDKRAPSASRAPAANGREIPITTSTSIDVIKNRVQIIIVVPGAQNLVKDRIKIRSRRLREEQELTLTFARPRISKTEEPKKP